jgi:hypothetical protein
MTNITSTKWLVEHRQITNLKTNEVRQTSDGANARHLAAISEKEFDAQTAQAFELGSWRSGDCRYLRHN